MINCVIYRDDTRKEIIVGFSATKNTMQLINEALQSFGVEYKLHSITGAKVMDYFYRQYLKFTTWLIPSLKDVGLTEYSTVFVGHSLGGAMAVHAAVDVIMS